MDAASDKVIVVGAGPVGLTTAYLLAGDGIPCTVLEAAERPPEDLRASTFHPPTLDMLAGIGLAEPLIAEGLVCPAWQIRLHGTDDRVVFDLSILAGETDHPYRLQCEQFRLVRLLLARVAALGVEVRFGSPVASVAQTSDGVSAVIRRNGADEVVSGRFLVGADGARSVVRTAAGIGFDGETYPETTILVTTPFPFEEHLPGLSNVNYCWSAEGTFTLLRLPALWRCSLYPDDGEAIEDAVTPDSVQRKLQRVVAMCEPYPVGEIRPYRVHMRIADDYRRGRVVLAGDAAHINSPSGGMGMNGGIHDAFALARTLAAIWAGGELDLLDRYTRQRRPVALEEVLAQADRNRARMRERDPARRAAILADLRRTMADRATARDYLLRTSMIAGLRRAAAIA